MVEIREKHPVVDTPAMTRAADTDAASDASSGGLGVDGLAVAADQDLERLLEQPLVELNTILPNVLEHVRGPWKTVPLAEGLSLDQSRYPGELGIPELLAQIGSGPAKEQLVATLVKAITAMTGQEPNPLLIKMALRNPNVLLRLTCVTPAQMSAASVQLAKAVQAHKLPPVGPPKYVLDTHTDLDHLDYSTIEIDPIEPEPLLGNVYRGDRPSDAPLLNKQRNTVVAEVINRLARNQSAPADERFSVTLGGVRYDALDTFVDALRAGGYQIEVRLRLQGADLGDFSVDEGGTKHAVAAPLFSLMEAADEEGRRVLVPVPHGGLNFEITPPEAGGFGGRFGFYQGLSRTGVYTAELTRGGAWIGGSDLIVLTGETAATHLRRVGKQSDVTRVAAAALGLDRDAYGIAGNCLDSVAQPISQIAQEALDSDDVRLTPELQAIKPVLGVETDRELLAALREGFAYPMLMQDALLTRELKKRLAKGDDEDYQALLASINVVPNDITETESSLRRALISLMLVWPDGTEPMSAVVHAKKVLREKLGLAGE